MFKIKSTCINKNKAFTLAEILVTLGIIGVISAMTIPALSAKVQKIELESAFKVTYARITQMLQSIEADYGSVANVAQNDDEFVNLLKSYSAGASICKKGQAVGVCWPSNWFTLRGTRPTSTETSMNMITLANGAVININGYSATCTNQTELVEPIGCARLRVDTNGKKLPNRVGYDIFDFYITYEGLIPRGDPRTTVTEDNADGWGKASYLLRNGKIDY